MNRLIAVVAAVLLAALTACGTDPAPAPSAPTSVAISVLQADQFKLDFAYAVPQLKDATSTDVRKILIGVCDPTSDEALVVDQLVRRVLGVAPTVYQRDSLLNAAAAVCVPR